MTDEDRRMARQKTKRNVMGGLLALLVLSGAALFAVSNQYSDDEPLPTASQQMDNETLRPASTPGAQPAPPALPEQPATP
jgi:hypothetical protein